MPPRPHSSFSVSPRTRSRCEGGAKPIRDLLTLRPHLGRHRGAYALCVLGLLVSSLFGLLVPWMIRGAIDGIPLPDGRERLTRAIAWILLFAALHGAFRYLARRGLLVTARRVEQRLRGEVFSHVIRLPLSFFQATPTGDVMSRLTNDISAVWLFLGPGLLTLAGTVMSYILALFFMARISPELTAVSLALAPAVVLLSREYGKAFHRLHRGVQESLAGINAVLQENISGIRLVRAGGMEEAEEERFGAHCRDYYRRNVAVSKSQAAFHGAIGFLAGAGVALVLGAGGWLVIRGTLTLGGFVAFNAYLAMLAFPTMALGWVINLFQRGGAAMGRINEFVRTPAEGPPAEDESSEAPGIPASRCSPGAKEDPASRCSPGAKEDPVSRCSPGAKEGFLRIENLSFSYPGEGRARVLDGLSLSVSRGELVGLVGPTGSGKSTLLALLQRLYDVPRGTVFLDGRDVCDIPLPELRRRIAVVSQDPFLFSDTILENICFGLAAPDEGLAREAARKARFLAEIEEMPARFLTVIGERGVSLSGGQKQRATIARALCGEAALVALDDALSSVDSETEQEIFREILAVRGSRTVIFSTHRMASLSRCDRVFVLGGGRIAEEGTHDELLSRGGLYRDLYSRQMLARELEAAR